ncbi:hypothetical protein V8E55_007193, partial [Tylopilus felleus]
SLTILSSGIYAVRKLTDSNWVEFKVKTTTSLITHGLSHHLNSTVKASAPFPMMKDNPSKIFKLDGKTPTTEADMEVNLVLIEAYAPRWVLATQQCFSTIPLSVMIQIQLKGSFSEMWTVLCDMYKAKSDLVQVDVQACLQNMKCGKKEDIKKHLLSIMTLCKQPTGMNVPVDNHDFTA